MSDTPSTTPGPVEAPTGPQDTAPVPPGALSPCDGTVPVEITPGPDDAAAEDRPAAERTDLRGLLAGHHDPNARDHVALAVGHLAGVTDRGLRRRRNEDAFALGRRRTAAGDLFVAAVCDGVASARRGDEASLAAVEAAVAAVLDATDPDGPAPTVAEPATGPAAGEPDAPGEPDDTSDPDNTSDPGAATPEAPTPQAPTPGASDLDALAAAAARAAATAAADLGRGTSGGDTPACTYVGAVGLRADAVVSWVGDSRVYWLADDGSSRLLTVDDSWAEEIAAAGLMPRDQAFTDRRAHVLTRWLGFDSPGGPARSRWVRVASPGVLMLCSDGVWNHLPDAEVLAGLVRGRDVVAASDALVAAALDAGGHDNATVAVLPLTPDDDPDTDGVRIEGQVGEERTGPIPIGGGGDPS